MASVYPNPIALGMDAGKPIAMGSKEDMDMINTYSMIEVQDDHKDNEDEWMNICSLIE